MELREIDRLIAIHVMGYDEDQIYKEYDKYVKGKKVSEGALRIRLDKGSNFSRVTLLPYYSKFDDAAWSVVNKLSVDYTNVEIHVENSMVNVLITEHFDNGFLKNVYQGYEDTLGMSVCKAALKAKGIDI
jgi:hypothetical protein